MGAGVEDVAVAVQQASAGTRLLEDEIIQVAVRRLHSLQACEPHAGELDHSLSRREMEVLRCIAENKSNSEIAASLYIQLCTVKHHVHHILEKLQVQHRWDAARLAQERGWI
jgi:DNA-binding NarL/FixJ family response regulator